MEMQIKELEVAFGSHKSYSVFVDNNEIDTLVTHDHAMVRKWVNSTENSNRCRLNCLIVGLDTEWRKNPVNNCYRSTIPLELRQFLENPNYKFVGVGVDNYVKMLFNDHGLRVMNTGDIPSWAEPKTIAMSEWDKLELEQDQVAYACLDAYFSFEIGRQLSAWY
ncbi:hypothetical protein ABFX02_09G058800 [Erythranthe guttata]